MKGTVLYGPRDVRFEEIETPKITKPTDAIIRISATCVCGSDLWPYRGLQPVNEPTPMGHEYCGIVEEVGSEVRSVKPGQFVIVSFATSDNTCPHCQAGYQSSCVNREWMLRAQAPVLRVPNADGTLVPAPDIPSDDLIPSLLATAAVHHHRPGVAHDERDTRTLGQRQGCSVHRAPHRCLPRPAYSRDTSRDFAATRSAVSLPSVNHS